MLSAICCIVSAVIHNYCALLKGYTLYASVVTVAPVLYRAASPGVQSFDNCSWATVENSHYLEHERQLTGRPGWFVKRVVLHEGFTRMLLLAV